MIYNSILMSLTTELTKISKATKFQFVFFVIIVTFVV